MKQKLYYYSLLLTGLVILIGFFNIIFCWFAPVVLEFETYLHYKIPFLCTDVLITYPLVFFEYISIIGIGLSVLSFGFALINGYKIIASFVLFLLLLITTWCLYKEIVYLEYFDILKQFIWWL